MSSLYISSIILFSLLAAGAAAREATSVVYVGTDTAHGGKGIYSYTFDSASGELKPLGVAAETADPFFLVVDSRRRALYAVNEVEAFQGQPTGSVSAFTLGPDGKLGLLNQVSSRDAGPAHVSLDRAGKYVFASNYPRGSVAVFRILGDGRLGESTAFVQHHGTGFDPKRQEAPHAHAVEMSPDNRFALVADLGLDEIFVYPFDAAKGTLGEPQVTKVKPGSGPRHLVFSADGKFVYLLNELSSTVMVFAYGAAKGSLSEVQTISALAWDFRGQRFASEIALHPSGKFLYVSNRGEDSIAAFAIDATSGRLALIQSAASGGKIPRHFAIDPSGAWLLAGNQESDNITTFHIDAKTGRLTASGHSIHVPKPMCIVFSRAH